MRLLLAEDERSLSKALCRILQGNGYIVDAVYDGEEALEYLAADNYDGAILDIMMPKIDGLGVLKAVRERGSRIPVLMLTAKSEVDDRVKGLDSGADDYLTKPFSSKELLARVRAMTRTLSAENNVLQTGNISLDRIAFELSSPTGSFLLANREFQIMESLMCSFGHTVSEERLLEKVWSHEVSEEKNIILLYISDLRKKLGSLHANIYINASYGEGYRLEMIQ